MNRKFTADAIFNGYEILPQATVIVTTASGEILELVPLEDAGPDVEVITGILSPAFVNAHCHLELSHLKGLAPQKSGLVDFVQLVMTRRASVEELKLDAMRNAEAEMQAAGIIAVGDICNTADSIAIKLKSKLHFHNFLEVSGFVNSAAVTRLGMLKELQQQFSAKLPHQPNSLSPHAPYSVSGRLFQLLDEATHGSAITIHNQESLAENELYLCKTGDFLRLYEQFGIPIDAFTATGKSSMQSWLPYFDNRQSMIVVHNTFTSADDLEYATQRVLSQGQEVFYCLCPNANLYIENRLPPVELLRRHNCRVVVGTDSCASNDQLSVLEELKILQGITQEPIPLVELLGWATVNGAAALRMPGIGSIETGKTPGIVQLYPLHAGKLSVDTRVRRVI